MLPKVFKTHSLFSTVIIKFISPGIIILFFASSVSAQGNLLITPKRVVFDGTKRSEELNLANIGKDSATYEISFIQIRMKKDGTVETITEPDSAQLFADKYLRFFPRTVTLAPNEAQTVKVQIRKTEDMAEGEYRSHMYFRAVPNEKPLGEKEPAKDSGISVRLIPIFGISIPVIIRVGEYAASLEFSEIAVEEKNNIPTLQFTLNRKGSMSLYGDVIVDHISEQGKTTRVGLVKGIAVYTPNNVRQFRLPLNNSGINYHSGKLHVAFTDQSVKQTKLAEQHIDLN